METMLVFRRDGIVSVSSSSSSLIIKCVCIYRCFFFPFFPLIDCLFSSTSNKTTKQISYIKIFLIMCMTCIHISLLSSQCFSVLNSNDSHKRFLSKGFYILFPPLSLSFALYCFEYFCLICDVMCLWKGQ